MTGLSYDMTHLLAGGMVVVSGPAISQFVGMRAMGEGREYCLARLPSLAHVREDDGEDHILGG